MAANQKKRLSRRRRSQRRRLVSAIVTVAACAALAIGLFVWMTRPSDVETLDRSSVQEIDEKVLEKNVKTSFSEVYPAADYTIFGEDLTLLAEPFSAAADPLMGANVVLRNVETGHETTFTFGGSADTGISLSELGEGVYEIYVYDQYQKKRVYFEAKTESEPFYTVRRDGKVNSVQIEASTDLFKEQGLKLDRNYAFLTVTEQIPKVRITDVIIDPGGQVFNEGLNAVETDLSNNTISEAKASMELAQMIRERLEASGLRVTFTRTDQDSPGYYGKSSRTGQGYDQQAKVFLNLSMISEPDSISRPLLTASPSTIGTLPNQIAESMDQAGLELAATESQELLEDGVSYDTLVLYDGDREYALHPQLRETGGKSSGTGEAPIATANSLYQDAYGMYGVMFTFANLQSDESISYYLQHKEAIADAVAAGILNFLNIEVYNP